MHPFLLALMLVFAIPAAHAMSGAADAGQAQGQDQLQSEAVALDGYVGTYPLMPGFDLAISERDGTLYGQATGQPEVPLSHAGDDVFGNPSIGLELHFERDAEGTVTGLELRQSGQVIQAERR